MLYKQLGSHNGWRKVEMLIGLISISWGLQVLRQDIHTMAMDPTYKYQVALAPEWIWGLTFSVVGIITFYAAWMYQHHLRRIAILIGVLIWCTLGVMALLGNPASGAAPTWIIISISCSLCYISGEHCHLIKNSCNTVTEATIFNIVRNLITSEKRRSIKGQ